MFVIMTIDKVGLKRRKKKQKGWIILLLFRETFCPSLTTIYIDLVTIEFRMIVCLCLFIYI